MERLIEECGLEGANTVATPGVKHSLKEIGEDGELPARLHTPFRGAAARGNYLAADRVDIQFACKEVCRTMSSPTEQSWKALKRISRYLGGRPRLVYMYPYQEVTHIDTYVDTDWAGCPKTRKSTSGGSIMLGRHLIKHWSSTQPSLSLSSGEAEFYGVVRGTGQGLGYQSLLRDMGLELPLRLWTDSSAALGICSRQGLGKLRHIDTHTLWAQQAVRSGRVAVKKIPGERNPADLLTKHGMSADRIRTLVELHGGRYREGRPACAPQKKNGATGKTKISEADHLCEIGMKGLSDVEASPIMPHLTLEEEELEASYPSLQAVDDIPLDDLTRLEDDQLHNAGMKVVQEILEQMATEGRVREHSA